MILLQGCPQDLKISLLSDCLTIAGVSVGPKNARGTINTTCVWKRKKHWLGALKETELEYLKTGKALYRNKQKERHQGRKPCEQRAIMNKVCLMGTPRQTCLKETPREMGTKLLVVEKEIPIPFI